MDDVIDCPLCQASNTQSPCRRCKADLHLLFAVASQQRQQLHQARQALRQGQLDRAKQTLIAAASLWRNAETVRLQSLVALLEGDFGKAWVDYTRWRQRHSGDAP